MCFSLNIKEMIHVTMTNYLKMKWGNEAQCALFVSHQRGFRQTQTPSSCSDTWTHTCSWGNRPLRHIAGLLPLAIYTFGNSAQPDGQQVYLTNFKPEILNWNEWNVKLLLFFFLYYIFMLCSKANCIITFSINWCSFILC